VDLYPFNNIVFNWGVSYILQLGKPGKVTMGVVELDMQFKI